MTTAVEKIFLSQAQLIIKLNQPVPSDPVDAEIFLNRKVKLTDYLFELKEVENLIDELDFDDERVEALNEKFFYSRIASASDYNMLYDGTYVKLVEINAHHELLPTTWAFWCKRISLVK